MTQAPPILAAGRGEYVQPDPDAFRAYVRGHKDRRLVSKLMSERDAVSRYVADGDYLAYDLNIAARGPGSLFREIIRQRKKDLWVMAKFTWTDVSLLIAGGCVSKVDVGWMESGPILNRSIKDGTVKLIEWSNGALAYRLLAGSLGVPYLPMRYLGGTDTFDRSGAILTEDPYNHKPICVVPALNPDVALIHAHQADIHGNTRIFGAGVSPVEMAMASKNVIVSAEEIIEPDEIRKEPQRTTIPYYFVDAVVHAPFGSYPGSTQGLYSADLEQWLAFAAAGATGKMDEYLDKWVYSVESHQEMLDKNVGEAKLKALREADTLKEGYYD
jgi:acyl CoA:acetate/3-ketoacid CoA transferase alpha subunit